MIHQMKNINWINHGFNIIFLVILIYQSTANDNIDCDQTFRSSIDAQNGSFYSPNYPQNYKPGLRCIYKFIGLQNERVQINFTFLQLRGNSIRCNQDYIDVYIQTKYEDQDVLKVPLHDRFCGRLLDKVPLYISMTNIFIIGFYSNFGGIGMKGFEAQYQFIDGAKYNIGERDPNPDICGTTITSTNTPAGILMSPTYPGQYPNNIFCFYKLQGTVGQRIRISFIVFDLFSGGEHCPYDYVKIYDGYTNQSPVIGTYCGHYADLQIFSTRNALLMEFSTKEGRVNPKIKGSKIRPTNRTGFEAAFEMSTRFVDLKFITDGIHIRGSECDQRVMSKGENNGTIKSPNYPHHYPLNVTCRYLLDGLENRQTLEKSHLEFSHFNVPYIQKKCDNGHMSAYLRGQPLTSAPDSIVCGNHLPTNLTSYEHPQMVLVLDTHGSRPGTGFLGNFLFVTDYAIPGTPATDTKCHFLYHSSSSKVGLFNSPRNPSNYPINMQCIYEFIGSEREQIRFTFESFKVVHKYPNCTTDYVSFYAISKSKSPRTTTAMATRVPTDHDVLIGHYCGEMSPGPLVSEDVSTVKVVFNSDASDVSIGFRARYEFIQRKPLSKRCFMNITRGGGGLLMSPNYPLKYLINSTCEWHIYAQQPNARILLQFVFFSIEGNMKSVGCRNAVLKIYEDHSGMPQHQLCGPIPGVPNNFLKEVISKRNFIKIRFISAARAVGAKGFKITWTEITEKETGDFCGGFLCKISKHCIAKSLECNSQPNCGDGDTSDEGENCDATYTDHGVLYIILGVVISLIFLIFLLVCILHRRRKAHKKKHKQEIEVRYVTRGGMGAVVRDPRDGGPRSDQMLLKERTEKVSIV